MILRRKNHLHVWLFLLSVQAFDPGNHKFSLKDSLAMWKRIDKQTFPSNLPSESNRPWGIWPEGWSIRLQLSTSTKTTLSTLLILSSISLLQLPSSSSSPSNQTRSWSGESSERLLASPVLHKKTKSVHMSCTDQRTIAEAGKRVLKKEMHGQVKLTAACTGLQQYGFASMHSIPNLSQMHYFIKD